MNREGLLQSDAAPEAESAPPASSETANTNDFSLAAYRGQPAWKRALDLFGASVGLIGLLPLFAVVAICIKAGSKGPVIFRQRRLGAGGQPFVMLKFRTMQVSTDQGEHVDYVREQMKCSQQLRKLDRRQEVIPLGGLMRAASIDELPQLVNVLRGEMSLVGPRPDVAELEDYENWQTERFAVLPGLTGLWQVGGKNERTFDEMMQLDVDYVKRRSLWLDALILLKTPGVLLRQLQRKNG